MKNIKEKARTAKRLSLEFFHRHALTAGVLTFIASLIFSCNYMLQFAPEIPPSAAWAEFTSLEIKDTGVVLKYGSLAALEYAMNFDFWTKIALIIAGIGFMITQIITFVMYKKCKKMWVLKLYLVLTLMSLFATFGSFATGLEKRRIAAGQSDMGLMSLVEKKRTVQSLIDKQNAMIDRYLGFDNPHIKKADAIGNKVKKNTLLLNEINDEIADYSKGGNIGHDSTAEMFSRVASVIQVFSFGRMLDETRDIIAMLLECIAFILVAVAIDYSAAACAVIAVRIEDDEFQELLNDEATDHARESASRAMFKEDKLTHTERMKSVKARKVGPSPVSSLAPSPAPSASYNSYTPQAQTYDLKTERIRRRPDTTSQLETIHVDSVDTKAGHVDMNFDRVNTAPKIDLYPDNKPEIDNPKSQKIEAEKIPVSDSQESQISKAEKSQFSGDEKSTQIKSLPGGAKNWDSASEKIPVSDDQKSQIIGVKNPSFRKGRKSQKTANRITEYSHELLPRYINALFDPPKPSGSLQGMHKTGTRLNFVRRVSEQCHKELLKLGLTKLQNKGGRQYTYPAMGEKDMLKKVKAVHGVG